MSRLTPLAVEMVTELIQGLIAAVVLGSMAAIAIVEAAAGRPFSEPTTLGALAGAVVGFYFRSSATRQLTRVSGANVETQTATQVIPPAPPAAPAPARVDPTAWGTDAPHQGQG